MLNGTAPFEELAADSHIYETAHAFAAQHFSNRADVGLSIDRYAPRELVVIVPILHDVTPCSMVRMMLHRAAPCCTMQQKTRKGGRCPLANYMSEARRSEANKPGNPGKGVSEMALSSISEYKGALERARAQIRNYKEHGQRMTVLGSHTLLTASGGAISGVLRVKKPTIADKVPTDLLVGSAFCTAAMLDLGGDYSDELNAIGSGMIAAYTAREVEEALRR